MFGDKPLYPSPDCTLCRGAGVVATKFSSLPAIEAPCMRCMANQCPTCKGQLPAHKRGCDYCEHRSVIPEFDAAAARQLDAAEVRARWPRFQGQCPQCRKQVIAYASAEHYIAGDW